MSEWGPAGLRAGYLAFDCAGPVPLAEFWAAVLGGSVEVDSSGDATVHLPVGGPLDFLRVPEGKSGKNRLHLDLHCDDFDAAVDAVLALGATKADDVYDGGNWQVLRDPEGNEFCILKPRVP